MTSEPITLEAVRRLVVAPDEVLVVRVPGRVTSGDVARLHEVFQDVGIERVVVMVGDVELDVVKQERDVAQ